MATRKRPSRKPSGRAQRPGRRSRTASASRTRKIKPDVDAISERLDMMLPELIARVAAVEHLLVEKGICSHENLLSSRRFIDEQESW